MLISIQRSFLLLLVFPILLFGQEEKKTLLIIPLSKDNIRLSSLAERNLRYNNLDRDSLVDYIVNISHSELQLVFRDYSLRYLKEFAPGAEFPDSVYNLKLFNCFYFDRKDSSLKNIKYKSLSLESYHNNYYGFDPLPEGLEILKNAITSSKCDYILFLNKFEIINPNSIFSLHLEVMDNALNRVYGNKNELKRDISKTMYGDVLKYYTRSCFDDALGKTVKYLREQK